MHSDRHARGMSNCQVLFFGDYMKVWFDLIMQGVKMYVLFVADFILTLKKQLDLPLKCMRLKPFGVNIGSFLRFEHSRRAQTRADQLGWGNNSKNEFLISKTKSAPRIICIFI